MGRRHPQCAFRNSRIAVQDHFQKDTGNTVERRLKKCGEQVYFQMLKGKLL